MEQTAVSIIRFSSEDIIKKRQLKKSILNKRERLTRLLTQNEILKVELDMVRQEYDVRVGSLYLKDNQLDLEIIHYNNIMQLMDEGIVYEEAIKQLEETYYAEQLNIEKEKAKIREDEEKILKREKIESDITIKDIKKLWKQLIAKFHPDLVQDQIEKKRREEIIKQVNRAYEEYNFAVLQQIDNDSHIESFEQSTIEKLEEILVSIENEIIKQMILTEKLKSSEWVSWKNRIAYARKKNIDIFKDIERKLLNDIVSKYAVLNKLKQDVEEKEKRIRKEIISTKTNLHTSASDMQ